MINVFIMYIMYHITQLFSLSFLSTIMPATEPCSTTFRTSGSHAQCTFFLFVLVFYLYSFCSSMFIFFINDSKSFPFISLTFLLIIFFSVYSFSTSYNITIAYHTWSVLSTVVKAWGVEHASINIYSTNFLPFSWRSVYINILQYSGSSSYFFRQFFM